MFSGSSEKKDLSESENENDDMDSASNRTIDLGNI